jgi:hypothetical protein
MAVTSSYSVGALHMPKFEQYLHPISVHVWLRMQAVTVMLFRKVLYHEMSVTLNSTKTRSQCASSHPKLKAVFRSSSVFVFANFRSASGAAMTSLKHLPHSAALCCAAAQVVQVALGAAACRGYAVTHGCAGGGHRCRQPRPLPPLKPMTFLDKHEICVS